MFQGKNANLDLINIVRMSLSFEVVMQNVQCMFHV